MDQLETLQNIYATNTIEDALKLTTELFPTTTKFSTSLGQEDQVLTDMISTNHIPVNIFTLDTGRLFNETYELLELTEAKYRIRIVIYFPEHSAVERMVNAKGINLFYESVENRKLCCGLRKVEPLNRALANTDVWITGLRADQNEHRKQLPQVEWLEDRKLYKINPLINFSFDDVIAYLNSKGVPYNKLHDKGFISIGCAPCTRAIAKGEDIRAGRWWWETSHKECGLHVEEALQPVG